MAEPAGWTTPSAIGEYAFCPRAHHYRQQGAPAPSPSSVAGERYHHRTLSAELRRDRHPGIAWAAVALGLLLLALAARALLG